MGDFNGSAELYQTYKPLLFSLAYRMLGSVMDAEDIVQEAFLSLNMTAEGHVRDTKSYLCKIVTNRCLDTLQSARKQREVYIGPWLPEPLVSARQDGADDPSHIYLQKESLSTAFLLLLEQLSSVERAVFLLREALGYDYEEIADLVGKNAANCRQIFHRAKKGLGLPETDAENTLAIPAKNTATMAMVEQFMQALSAGDIGTLMNVLAPDVTLYMDGGGKVTALPRPVTGAQRIVNFLQLSLQTPGMSTAFATVNGDPGLLLYNDGTLYAVVAVHAEQARITAMYSVLNPEKLRHL